MRGQPGASALQAYHAARAAQRRAATRALVLLIAGGAAAGAALESGSRALAGALAAGALIAAWVARPQPDPERWLRGARGEAGTAELLSRLPASDWSVFHDLAVPGSAANIDHLVIGPTGVWVVDTKTTRTAARARWRAVWLGNRRLDVGPLRWESEVVSDRLAVPVRPLVALHGGHIRRRGVRCGGVRVVPAEGLVRRIRRGRRRLDPRDVAELTGLAERTFRPAARRNGESIEPRGRRR